MFSGFTDISSLLQENASFFISLSVFLGLIVGSFLNVVIYRLPKMMENEWHKNCLELQGKEILESTKYTLANPRSACPNCGHKITAVENIPIISYLFLLRGKCSSCKSAISMRYPLIEALTGILIGLVSWKFGYVSITPFAWAYVFALISLTFIDFDTQLLPDDITLPLLWQLLPAVILLSSVLGAVIGISLIVFTKRGREIPMPFGPFLAIGGIAALFLGPQLASLYLN